MGCVFGCFRVKDHGWNHAYLFSSTNKAEFLKSCETQPETLISQHDEDDAASKFHSCLPTMSCWKLLLGGQYAELPTCSASLYEEFGKVPFLKDSDSPKHLSNSSNKPKHTRRNPTQVLEDDIYGIEDPVNLQVCSNNADNILPYMPGAQITASQDHNKYARFECTEQSPSEIDRSCKQSDSLDLEVTHTQVLKLNHSPYPTPLKLADQMQTPGTVYPINSDKLAIGENARIRSEYVYPVLNVVENLSQWKELEKYSNSHKLGTGEYLDKREDASPERPESGMSSDNETPIFGPVAEHWKDEQSQISPKWWGWNGVPNSASKYKKDQVVSWHASPFEERLQKALSDERLVPQRKSDLDESEESDTAASGFSSWNHGNSILVNGL